MQCAQECSKAACGAFYVQVKLHSIRKLSVLWEDSNIHTQVFEDTPVWSCPLWNDHRTNCFPSEGWRVDLLLGSRGRLQRLQGCDKPNQRRLQLLLQIITMTLDHMIINIPLLHSTFLFFSRLCTYCLELSGKVTLQNSGCKWPIVGKDWAWKVQNKISTYFFFWNIPGKYMSILV